jgi:hypothetical protein
MCLMGLGGWSMFLNDFSNLGPELKTLNEMIRYIIEKWAWAQSAGFSLIHTTNLITPTAVWIEIRCVRKSLNSVAQASIMGRQAGVANYLARWHPMIDCLIHPHQMIDGRRP